MTAPENPYDPDPDNALSDEQIPLHAAWEQGRIAGYCQGRDNERAAADSWWRSRLESDETVEAVANALLAEWPMVAKDLRAVWDSPFIHDAGVPERWLARAALAALLPVAEKPPGGKPLTCIDGCTSCEHGFPCGRRGYAVAEKPGPRTGATSREQREAAIQKATAIVDGDTTGLLRPAVRPEKPETDT